MHLIDWAVFAWTVNAYVKVMANITGSVVFLLRTQKTEMRVIISIATMSILIANQKGTPSDHWLAMMFSFRNS